MGKTDCYRLVLDTEVNMHIEKYIESLFQQWLIDEIFLGNILTSFSNLTPLLLEYSRNDYLGITAQLTDEVLSFEFTHVDLFVLKLFLKEQFIQDIQDNFTQSVFLIQKITDEVVVEGENLIFRFNIGILPTSYFSHRRKLLGEYFYNFTKKAENA